MNVIIIEDEALAAEKLEGLIREIDPSVKVLAKPGSIKEATLWLSQFNADLIFLDIQLSDGISFSIFEQVSVGTPVIFTTAYDQYAIKAFQLNSIAYLLKPVRKAELEVAIKKYHSLKTAFSIDFESLLAQIQGKDPGYRKRFLIQIGQKIRKIESNEIAYFYILEKSVYIKTFDNHSFPWDGSLESLEQTMDPGEFFRINRKYMVNMQAICGMTALSRGRIKLDLKPKTEEEFETIVSIDRSHAFRKWLNS